MAALGDVVASLRPMDFQRETDTGNDPAVALVLGVGEGGTGTAALSSDVRGLSLPKYVRGNVTAYGYVATFRIPDTATFALTVGLTFRIYLSDDGSNAADLGTKVAIGLAIKRVPANATLSVDTGAATEVVTACTLSSTSGGVSITSIAIGNAALPASTAVGDLIVMRLRRKGTDTTNDTCGGRAILYGVEIENT